MHSTEVIHKAAQYLATAAKSFIPSRSDDSHTNLGWNSDEGAFRTRGLNDEGLWLELNLRAYALDVVHPESGLSASFPLSGARHFDIVHWIDHERQFCGIQESYAFDLHYELPYDHSLDDHYVFPSLSNDALDAHIELRSKAQSVLAQVVEAFSMKPLEPRVWPHHFDTGCVLDWGQQGIRQVGIGLAMADAMSDEPYFYFSAYTDEGQWKSDARPPLSNGKWMSGDWSGAMLPAHHTSEEAGAFFKAAFNALPKE